MIRRLLKHVGNVAAFLVVLPIVGLYRLSSVVMTAKSAFPGYSQFFSLAPGFTGNYLRRAFYRQVLPACGNDVCICFGTVFSHPTASIGDRVYIGIGCMIGDVSIEDDVLVGSHVSIINGRRQHGTERLDVSIRDQRGEYPRVTIGRDSWIGDRAVVAADIGRQAIVGAASVVTSLVADRSIVAGNPARVRGIRGQNGNAATPDVEPDPTLVPLRTS